MERLPRNMQTYLQSNLLLQFNIGAGSFSIRASCFYILESWRNILLGFFYILSIVNYIGTTECYILAFVNHIFVIVNYIGTFETYILAFANYILPSGTPFFLCDWKSKWDSPPQRKMHILFLPNAFCRKKTKRAFPFPLFAHAKKRINFPHLSCIFTNKPHRKHSI